MIGSPMTYSLFEVAKERAEELIVVLSDDMATSSAPVSPTEHDHMAVISFPHKEPAGGEARPKKVKKEILTKQQKRRLADRCSEFISLNSCSV